MYEKPIAQLTREHLVSHLPAYLAEVERLDQLKLVMPKTVEISSIVGGIMDHKHLPAYALDVQTKEFSTTTENLWTYIYVGQITGMVSGKSALEVDDLVKGHKSAVELFCVRHKDAVFTTADSAFTIIGFEFSQSDFSGAIDQTKNPKTPFWVAAFQIGIAWLVSEEAPMQHA
jgi:hypothetical protein